jgi:predicted nucleic acid-binding protein
VGSPGARGRVTSAITFDAGALIAIERRSRRMQALLEEIDRRDWQVAVPAGAVAQAWRGGPRQARIAALLSDQRTEVVALDDPAARAVGLLWGRSGHADVVDVSVALCARQRNLHVVTSDPEDLHAVDDALILHVP